MTSVLIEHGQYVDDAGKPISGGKLYIGANGGDPVATAPSTTIYSDRALTIPIGNPQDLGTDGRALNKIWVDGEYSIQVNSLVGIVETQEFQDLDAGTSTDSVGTLEITNIIGNNTITGDTDSSITSYSANQQFIFTTTAANTGPVTLSIDTAGAKDVVKNNDQAILNAEFEASQVVMVTYNAVNDNFEWANQNNKVVDFYTGTTVASSATTNIWVTDGNTVGVSGTVGITSFGTAPNIGAWKNVIPEDALTITHGANLLLPGGVDYTTETGDILSVYAESLTRFLVTIQKKDGSAAIPGAMPLAAITLSNDATAEFTAFDASLYDNYVFILSNVVTADGVNLYLRTSSNGGSSFDSGASDYEYGEIRQADAALVSSGFTVAQIAIALNIGATGVEAESGVGGEFTVFGPHLTQRTRVLSHMSWTSDTAGQRQNIVGGQRASAADVDAIQLIASSGNLVSGTITMYGRRKFV